MSTMGVQVKSPVAGTRNNGLVSEPVAPKQETFAKGEICSRIPSDDFDPSLRMAGMGRDVRKYNVVSGARISYPDTRYGLRNITSFFFTTTAKCNVWIMKIYFLLLHNNRISSDARQTIKVVLPYRGRVMMLRTRKEIGQATMG